MESCDCQSDCQRYGFTLTDHLNKCFLLVSSFDINKLSVQIWNFKTCNFLGKITLSNNLLMVCMTGKVMNDNIYFMNNKVMITHNKVNIYQYITEKTTNDMKWSFCCFWFFWGVRIKKKIYVFSCFPTFFFLLGRDRLIVWIQKDYRAHAAEESCYENELWPHVFVYVMGR